MKIVAIRESTVPIGSAMRNASISFSGMTASALAIITDRVIDGVAVVGYAFDSIGRYGKGGLLRERFIPRLLDAPPDSLLDTEGLPDPEACWKCMMRDEKEGGHGERSGAVGLLDAALWDLRAKLRGEPLWRTLSRDFRYADAQADFATYGSCGHFQPGEGSEALRAEVRTALDLGYTTVKIKADGRDLRIDAPRIEAALLEVGSGHLAIDANGHVDPDDRGWIESVAAYGLAWIEEPVGPLEYAGLARFAQVYPGVIATGENLFSAADARNLLLYGGLRADRDRIQIDMLLAYGLPEYRRVMDLYRQQGWSRAAFWPHAGHLFAAHVVAGLGLGSHEAAPDAARIYGGFWDEARVEQGRMRIPEVLGVGYEHKQNLHAVLRELTN